MREVIKNDCHGLLAYDENMPGSGSDLCDTFQKIGGKTVRTFLVWMFKV